MEHPHNQLGQTASIASTLVERTLPPGPRGIEKWKWLREWLQTRDTVEIMGKLFELYGSVVRINDRTFILSGMEASRFVMLSDPALVQRAPLAEDGPPTLASKDGELHKKHRRAVMQAFRPEYLTQYVTMMNEIVEMRLQELPPRFNVMEKMRQLTLDATVYTMLGIHPNSPEYQAYFSEYWHLVNRGRKRAFPFHRKYQRGMEAKEKLWHLMRRVRDQQAQRENKDVFSAMSIISSQEGLVMTEEELFGYAYMLTEFGEGDVALMITYAVAALLTRPDLMEQFRAEHTLLGTEPLTLEKINSMTFTLNLLREVERLYPPVPFIQRYAAQELIFMNYRIPKGSKLINSIFETHRQSDLFQQPDEFDPARYLAPRIEQNQLSGLVGFGSGHHMCVAKTFTQLQASVVLHALFRLYSWQLEGLHRIPKIDYRGAAKPSSDIFLEISPRTTKEGQ
ncbi:cytochrome P450 [Brevibacillus dissolubilis]|uniref:cytochrome P450 n=1 Tax=Brevibacillus dissolubilis TaxID=1844116 RepID=UPI001115DA26|nr:cytochrome P450 [Brevibacillus dissolubilis]